MTSEEVNGTEKGIDNKLVFLYKTEERKLSHFHADETPHHSHIEVSSRRKPQCRFEVLLRGLGSAAHSLERPLLGRGLVL